jgi:hypothetical protein
MRFGIRNCYGVRERQALKEWVNPEIGVVIIAGILLRMAGGGGRGDVEHGSAFLR